MEGRKLPDQSSSKSKGHIFRLYCIILLLISAQIVYWRARSDSLANGRTFAESLNRIVFGDLWKLDEFCSNQRNDSVIVEDDIQTQRLLNMSSLSSIRFSGRNSTMDQLNNLNLIGVKSRRNIAVICSTNAWGYADIHDFEESNQPTMNSRVCELQVDDLYSTLKYLSKPNSCSNATNPYCLKEFNHLARADSLSTVAIFGEAYSQIVKLDKHVVNWLKIQANARVPPGPIFQAPIWLGDYPSCKRFSDMRYCLGSYRSGSWPQVAESSGLNSIRVGLCLPRHCNDENLKQNDLLAKVDSLLKYNLADLVGLTDENLYQLREVHCPPADDSPYRRILKDQRSKLLASLALFWALTLLYVNLLLNPQQRKNRFLSCFDLELIWRNFLKKDHLSHQLVGLNSIKVLATFWVVVTHVYVLTGTSYTSNIQDLRTSWRKSMLGAYINQGQHAVPIFFLISGLLVGHQHLGRPVNLFKFIACRYVRLMPMYLVVYAFIKQFGHLTGSGPLWDYGVSPESEARQCQQESWFVPMLMLANFIPPLAHCILTGWHVANDFQIYLTLPFLLSLYRRSRALGRLTALSCFLACHLYHAYNFHFSQKFTYDQLSREPAMFGVSIILDRMSYDYVNPLGRIGTYFLGVLLADLLFYNNVIQAGTKIAASRPPIRGKENDLELNYRSSDGSWLDELKSKSDDTTCKKASDPDGQATRNSREKSSSYQQGGYVETAGQWLLFNRLVSPSVRTLARFRNHLLGLLGLFLINLTLSTVIWPDESKDVFGSYGKSLSYPLCRLTVEIGFALVLYSLLAQNRVVHSSARTGPGEGESLRKPGEKQAGLTLMLSRSTGILAAVLNSSMWNLPVKLNYCVILVHFTIVRHLVQSQSQLLLYSWSNFLQLSSFVILLTYITSFVLHLALEVPLMSLVKIMASTFMARWK